MTSFARRERHSLCDLATASGPDAPTLSGEWTVKDLVVHMLVRERSPLGAPGILLPPLAGLTESVTRRLEQQDFDTLVARLRSPRLTPVALDLVEARVNALEFFVHHEDIRRASPGWTARTLERHDESVLWSLIQLLGRGLVRPAGVPVTIERTDTAATATLRRGPSPAVVRGLPSEIVLFLYGRRENQGLSFDGPEDAVRRLRGADLGI